LITTGLSFVENLDGFIDCLDCDDQVISDRILSAFPAPSTTRAITILALIWLGLVLPMVGLICVEWQNKRLAERLRVLIHTDDFTARDTKGIDSLIVEDEANANGGRQRARRSRNSAFVPAQGHLWRAQELSSGREGLF
jgi:hypothetical protein